ncbi:hypothetical protein Tco_1363735 [Tanacetum coccineum]
MQAGSVNTVPGNVQAGWIPQPAVTGAVTTQSWVPTPVQGLSYYNEGRSHDKDGSFHGGSGDQPARSSDE